jgi:transposase InsO family protein
VNWAITEKGYSQRRACALVGIDPRVYRYRSTRGDDGALRRRLRELSSERRRFGYRRLYILLRREGWEVNWKKLYRIYREERLTVRKRGGRKRALGTRAPLAIPQGPNQRWSLDFVSDALSCGRRFRVLCVIDDFSRECLTDETSRDSFAAAVLPSAHRHRHVAVTARVIWRGGFRGQNQRLAEPVRVGEARSGQTSVDCFPAELCRSQ